MKRIEDISLSSRSSFLGEWPLFNPTHSRVNLSGWCIRMTDKLVEEQLCDLLVVKGGEVSRIGDTRV